MNIIRYTNSPARGVVATIGYFDGVHNGHRYLLSQVVDFAKHHNLCSAAITFPVHPRKILNEYYQPETLTSFDHKINLLGTTGIDMSIVLEFTPTVAGYTAREFIHNLAAYYRVRTLFMGYDHRFGSDMIEDVREYQTIAREVGMQIIRTDAYKINGQQISSSHIRRLLLAGEIDAATSALGRYYELNGEVIHGHGFGKELGFPTANIQIDSSDRLLPRIGVYAVYVHVDGERYGGMADIGVRPTMHDAGGLSVEVHLFDYNGDLYGKNIRMEIVSFMRPEKRMSGREELSKQLAEDKIHAKQLLEC